MGKGKTMSVLWNWQNWRKLFRFQTTLRNSTSSCAGQLCWRDSFAKSVARLTRWTITVSKKVSSSSRGMYIQHKLTNSALVFTLTQSKSPALQAFKDLLVSFKTTHNVELVLPYQSVFWEGHLKITGHFEESVENVISLHCPKAPACSESISWWKWKIPLLEEKTACGHGSNGS